MNTKEKNDRFIQIASGGKKLDGEIKRLKEIPPLPLKVNQIPESNTVVKIRKEKTIDEKYASFVEEKAKLKAQLLPFLSKYSIDIKEDKTEINKFYYRKETDADKTNFNNVLKGKGKWEEIKTPHYIGETGKWNAFYLTDLKINSINKTKEYILSFESIDYDCDVYLNGRLVVKHIGFFAPFEADITPYIIEGVNSLLIVVHNDLTTSGITVNGSVHYGNKIYAATNIGYNEPELGWHHCPAGAGIIGKIFLIRSNKQRVTDCFIRPNIDTGEITVKTEITNYSENKEDVDVYYTIEGRNFKKEVFSNKKVEIQPLQIGENQFTNTFKINQFKLWTLDKPYLYDLTIIVKNKDGKTIASYQTHFGMRKFSMDLNSKPYKGAYYFNNERIMLRGTNEMGHLPRAVMENNDDQLIEDILIAKIAGLNFYRITQRPTLKKVYDYFDMLGMLSQTDFPLFSYITDRALGDAYKQLDEMERLTRNHPSVILETFCNETLDKTAWGKEQYVLSRLEMEKFFDIARGIVELVNPDRVVKYNEGDYAPIKNTYGISDFHCYTYWYISHGLPSGKLRKGYLPPIRPDYMCGCGEYGVDGLDRYDLMKKYAPKEWLPKSKKDPWSPKVIAKSQCYQLHGDFFEEQNDICSWIDASREFQAKAIKDYVNLLRIRSDYLQSTAVHLLIDAWPMGWTKTLVDVDRIPKPAYYEFKEANIKTRVFLRRDKYVIYENDNALVDVLVFNDKNVEKKVKVNVSVYYGKDIKNYEVSGVAKSTATTYLGSVKVASINNYQGDVKIVTQMIDDDKQTTYDEISIKVIEKLKKSRKTPLILGKSVKSITNICTGNLDMNTIFVDGDYYSNHQKDIEKKIKNGAKVVLVMNKPTNVLGKDIIFKTHTLEEEVRANNLIFASKNNKYSQEFSTYDFMNFYNKEKDYQDLTAWFKFYDDRFEEILYTLEDTNEEKYKFHKKHKLIMGEMNYFKGKLIVTTLSCLEGCVGCNPALDKLLLNIIND